ncbi:MAG TPA: hypothetical protein PKJ47_12270, partial [Candidatus Limiplasma sp.]|nr:hypothetical protein [Candidatus Limiplasma sp.]
QCPFFLGQCSAGVKPLPGLGVELQSLSPQRFPKKRANSPQGYEASAKAHCRGKPSTRPTPAAATDAYR